MRLVSERVGTSSQVGGQIFHLVLSEMWRSAEVERAGEKLVEVVVVVCGGLVL